MCAGITREIGSTSVNRDQPLSCMRQALLGADHARAGGCTRAKPARNDNLEPGFRFGGGSAKQGTVFVLDACVSRRGILLAWTDSWP